jgi:hypothetical protein
LYKLLLLWCHKAHKYIEIYIEPFENITDISYTNKIKIGVHIIKFKKNMYTCVQKNKIFLNDEIKYCLKREKKNFVRFKKTYPLKDLNVLFIKK